MFLFSDRGTPYGYRHMNGYGSHTFKMVNAKGEANYVKFHFKTDQKIKNFYRQEADEMTMKDPDFAIRDLFNAIADGNPPSWTLYIQVMTFAEAERWQFNPFDLTKVWPHAEFPLHQVGKMTLNRNPKNYFADVEQAAYSPASFVPGVEASPDKMLQGRLFSYDDTHRHRLGANFYQIPVNCPYRASVRHYQRDGPMNVETNHGGAPNYFPNSFSGPNDNKKYNEADFKAGDVSRYNSADEDNFSQPGDFWRKVLKKDEQDRLVDNIASHLTNAQAFIQERAVGNFSQVDKNFGAQLQKKLQEYNNKK